jgi:carbon monoxide dehydrogenase subunit G
MELEHRFTVAAPVAQAWALLLDLERIAPCLPGATLTSYEGDEFAGEVRVRIGPVTMTFAGQGRFVERDPGEHRMVIEAAGKDRRGGGTARASVRAQLREQDGGTAVEVHTDLVITGRAAQFGRGMIGEISNRLLGQFTDCLAGKLGETGDTGSAASAAVPAAAKATSAPAPPASAASAPAPPVAPAAVPPAPAHPGTEPIDLLAVTGVRAATARFVPYLVAFLAGAIVGGGIVALLMR